MATPRLKQPLNPQAVAAANKQFWKDHPELRGEQLGADADWHLRKEWVDDYLAAGGKLETEPDVAPDAAAVTEPVAPAVEAPPKKKRTRFHPALSATLAIILGACVAGSFGCRRRPQNRWPVMT